MMKHAIINCIIGLGNFGNEFIGTRHNIGKDFLNWIAKQENLSWQTKSNFNKAELIINNKKIILIITNLYMNESGKIISNISQYFETPENILIICDDLQIKFGEYKLRQGKDRGERGHNGLRSINSFLKNKFDISPYYFSIGIDRPENKSEVGDYVIEKFNTLEKNKIEEIFINAYLELKSQLI